MAFPWQKIRPLLDEALELPVDKRQEFVDQACGDPELRRQVVSILRAYDDETFFLDRPLVDLGESLGERQPGDRIGSYELIKRLGEGGMGTVYLARRADDSFSKQVAIKLLRRTVNSEELIRRFRHERQILASLEHPHIAKLLDGGSTEEGFPYLVMEYIDGKPIDVYCEERSLTVAERLELFAKICRAVQFAHQNFIVHRDLKPSNILVDTQGEPHLLDFGIAKTLAPEAFPETVVATRTGWTPMTPEYASPEQVQGRSITTASDVYSLGVLLFRLLTDSMPYVFDGRDLTAVVDAICHQDVPRPSSHLLSTETDHDSRSAIEIQNLRRTLRGDLDAIILKALCKEPESRYATAAQLLDDIQRYFDSRPVQARHETLIYRASRFLRRHRLGLSAAAAVCLVVLFSFIALLAQQQRIRQERNRAILERNRATTVSSWLIELFELPDPGRSLGERVTARELLDKSRASIQQELADQPELQAILLGTLGRTYAQLGQLPEARELLSASISLQRHLPGSSTALLASNLHHLAETLAFQGDFPAAQKVAREALLLLTQQEPENAAYPNPSSGEKLAVEGLLAHIEARLGHYDEAERNFQSALDTPTTDIEKRAKVLEMQADFERERGNSGESRAIFEEALALRRRLHGENHPEIALLESSLASVLRADDPEQAEELFLNAVERQRQLYEGAHPVLATAINNLALHLYDSERFDEAETLFRESLAMKYDLYGDSHPKIAATLSNLGGLARLRGRKDEAENTYRQALAIYARELGKAHPEYAFGLSNLGGLKMSQGELDAAQELLEAALEILEESLGTGHPKTAPIHNNLGEVARRRGDVESARVHFQHAVTAAHRDPGEIHNILPIALFNLAVILSDRGELQEAAEAYDEILDLLPEGRSLVLFTRTRLAWTRLQLDDPKSAATIARQALDAWTERDQERGSWGLTAQRTLALALLRLRRLDEAEALLRDRQSFFESSPGASDQELEQARADLLELQQARAAATPSPEAPS